MMSRECLFCCVPEDAVVTRVPGGFWRHGSDWFDCQGNKVDPPGKEIEDALGLGVSEDVIIDLYQANRMVAGAMPGDKEIFLCSRCVQVLQVGHGDVENFKGFSDLLWKSELGDEDGLRVMFGRQRFRRAGVCWDAFFGESAADVNLDDRLLDHGFNSYVQLVTDALLAHESKWNMESPSQVIVGWAVAIGLMMEVKMVKEDRLDVDDPYTCDPLGPSAFSGDILLGSFRIFGVDATIDPTVDPDTCNFFPPSRHLLVNGVKTYASKLKDPIVKKSDLVKASARKMQASDW